MKSLLPLIAVCALWTSSPASGQPQPEYFVNEAKLPFAGLPGLTGQRAWGVLNGAGYRIEIPQNWNGSLVMWAHGYRGTGLELTVDNHPLRPYLLANGFAWAASSYGSNGYAAAQGAKDTHALAQYFKDTYGKPTGTYVTGASLGGHVTALVAEQWPKAYDGAVSVCGGLGDYELFDFYLDFNVAAQTLSGVDKQYPFAADYLTATVPATKAALGPAFPFALNATGQELKSLTALRSGGVRPMFEQGWLYWNAVAADFLFGLGVDPSLTGRSGGVADNTGVVYQFDIDSQLTLAEQQFNAEVQRVAADPRARRRAGLAGIAPTTGDLEIPMVTLHTLGDLYVPFHMEQEYARRVAARGASDMLVQRATRDVGHCSFTPTELVQAFGDLVGWVQSGIKPAGDDVLEPSAVADPNFGCTFTDKTSPRIWDQVPPLAFLKPAACPVQ